MAKKVNKKKIVIDLEELCLLCIFVTGFLLGGSFILRLCWDILHG
jgi:hypothetical protein